MSNKELLFAMSNLMDQKLKPIKDTLDEHSEILKEHSEDIKDIKSTLKEHGEILKEHGEILKEHSEVLEVHSDILISHSDSIQSIKLLLENDFQPRLQNIEGCYLATFNRYRDGIDRIEQLEMNVDSLKQVVEEHSRQLQKIV